MKLLLLSTFLILVSFISLASCFTQAEYFVKDLERTTGTKFIAEVSSWYSSVTNSSSVKYYDCSGTYLMGGYNWDSSTIQQGDYFSRVYTDLPSHTTIIYTFKAWAIDSWDYPSTDRFQIQFDSLTTINSYQISFALNPVSLCGGPSWNDLPNTQLFGHIAHSSSSLTLKFISQFDEDTSNESFGVRDIQLIFINKNLGSDYICAYQSLSEPLYNFTICVCAPGQYSPTGVGADCTSCDPSCMSCYGAGADSCYECAEGYYFDGTSCTACDFSCSYCTGPAVNECISCPSGYAVFNGICIDQTRCISSPFVLDDDPEECVSPCSLATFDTWDDSCYPPCLANGILEKNGTCTTCTSLKINLLKETDNGYEYSMQLSPSSCDLDLDIVLKYLTITESSSGSVDPFTFTVTKSAANTYLIKLVLSKSVLKDTYLNAELNYLKGSMDVPKKFLSDSTLNAIASATSTISNVLNGFLAASFVGTLALGATSTLWSIISFQQFIGYFIYLNVEYPQSVQVFLSLLQTTFWEYLPNPLIRLLEAISEKIIQEGQELAPHYNPPQKFVDNEVTSFFIDNGGTQISSNLYALLLLLSLVLLLKKIKSLNKKPILTQIKILLRWNFIMRTFIEGGIPLSLSIFLQLRVASFRKAYLTVATTLAIISAIYMVIMFLFICTKLYYRDNQHLDKDHVRLMYETLYEGVSLSKPYSKCYYLVILARGCMLAFLVTFLESSPVAQIIPLIFFNIGLIYYLRKQVTFTNKKLNFIFKLKEVFILIGELCILCLCAEINSQNYYKILGYATVFFLATPLIVEVTYMVVMQIYQIRKIYKKIKEIVCKIYKAIFETKEDQRIPPIKIIPERKIIDLNNRRRRRFRNQITSTATLENSEMSIITEKNSFQ